MTTRLQNVPDYPYGGVNRKWSLWESPKIIEYAQVGTGIVRIKNIGGKKTFGNDEPCENVFVSYENPGMKWNL